MLFGLGEGLGFIFWKMKTMDFPFIGGRVKTDLLTEHLCQNLNLHLQVQETRSLKKAWKNVKDNIDQGVAVGLKLDCYHLEYFSNKIHFAGHYVAMYGYDEKYAYLVDTDQQGRNTKTLLKNLELARSEKGPMSSPNRSFTIRPNDQAIDFPTAIETAIRRNAKSYLNPPISNLYYKGIEKLSKVVLKWFKESEDVKRDFQTSAMLMERAGTGGSLFRNLYRDFLKEAMDYIDDDCLQQAHLAFVAIAKDWKQVSELFHEAGGSGNIKHIKEASEILKVLSSKEQSAVSLLSKIGKR